ncbi:hypothetical protein QFZ75_000359 [Streptomyces sp. V3I8]|nr:hypothetical protein [Streptomyces sp. V3I8]
MDLAPAVALGGDCLADVAILRAEPGVFGPVASDPAVSRSIGTLAASGEKALPAIRAVRSDVRKRVWELAGGRAPDAAGQATADLDGVLVGVLVVAHSDKVETVCFAQMARGSSRPVDGCVDRRIRLGLQRPLEPRRPGRPQPPPV